VRVEVIDTGVGIDPALLPSIFNAFEQGGRDVTRAYGGLGLGLNITKTLVDLHGGAITSHSDGKGRGATFAVELPATVPSKPSATQPQPCEPAVATSAANRDIRVLLVEDHPDTSRLMARLLRGSGYRVSTADSVSAALQTADTERFDVVVSDIGLPDGSGFDLIRQLLAKCPVKGIALSGFGMEEDVQRSKDAGFVEHLTKPIDPAKLEAVIHELTHPKAAEAV
jgi:CheY-like chemotaxis protein